MNAVDNLCKSLGLPHGDKFTQDWVYELAEEFRTKNWLEKYIFAYSNNNYSKSEKKILMELMLDVANDLLTEKINDNDEVIINLFNLLLKNHQSYLQLIDYWALDGELLEDCFALTPKIREIKNKINK